MNWLTAPNDEYLQSYIFRKLLVHGETDFSSVLTKNGMWKLNIETNINQQHIFKRTPEKHLIHLVKSNYKDHINCSFHHNAFYYLELYKQAFIQNETASYINRFKFTYLRKNHLQIYFCETCIKNSISHYGYGYFKNSWFNAKSCKIHNVPLSYLSETSENKSAELIREILSGIKPKTSHENTTNEIKTIQSKPIQYFNYPLSPCLLQLIINKIRRIPSKYHKNSTYLNEETNSMANYIDRKINDSSGVYKKINGYTLELTINKLVNNNHFDIYKFLLQECIETDTYNGINNINSCKQRILTPKKKDCLNCRFSKQICGLSLNIELFTVHPDTKVTIRKNYCDTIKKIRSAWSFYGREPLISNLTSIPDDILENESWSVTKKIFEYDILDVLI